MSATVGVRARIMRIVLERCGLAATLVAMGSSRFHSDKMSMAFVRSFLVIVLFGEVCVSEMHDRKPRSDLIKSVTCRVAAQYHRFDINHRLANIGLEQWMKEDEMTSLTEHDTQDRKRVSLAK